MSRAGKASPLPAALARGAIDSIGDPVLLVGPDGGLVHLNPAAEELFDRSRDRAVGLPVRALPGGAPPGSARTGSPTARSRLRSKSSSAAGLRCTTPPSGPTRRTGSPIESMAPRARAAGSGVALPALDTAFPACGRPG